MSAPVDPVIGTTQDINRESRYSGFFLRRKNATSGTDGKREPASIRKARGSLVDPFTEERQIAIECAIIERTQFDLDRCGIARDGAGKLEKTGADVAR